MHLLGRKALVVCAEIYPHRLEPLLEALLDLSVEVRPATLPEAGALEPAFEYRLTLQVVSQAGDTEGRVEVPRIPG